VNFERLGPSGCFRLRKYGPRFLPDRLSGRLFRRLRGRRVTALLATQFLCKPFLRREAQLFMTCEFSSQHLVSPVTRRYGEGRTWYAGADLLDRAPWLSAACTSDTTREWIVLFPPPGRFRSRRCFSKTKRMSCCKLNRRNSAFGWTI